MEHTARGFFFSELILLETEMASFRTGNDRSVPGYISACLESLESLQPPRQFVSISEEKNFPLASH